MLFIGPPDTTNERQRRFQANHPGYDRRRKARERAMSKNYLAKLKAAQMLAAQAERAAAAAQTAAEAPVIPVPTVRLALPAPVELPILPALNDLDSLRARLLECSANQKA